MLAPSPVARAAAPWGTPLMQPGIAAVTCAAPSSLPPASAYVFGLMDFRNPPAVNYGPLGPSAPLWNPPGYHDPSWTVQNIGAVYGIALDGGGDIYLAAHGLYSKTWGLTYYHRYGNLGGGSNSLAAAGTIYRINRTNGVPSVFAVLPQQAMSLGAGWTSGPGLGNVAYDADHNQFFATNLEDGRIYRLTSTGSIAQVFDPLGPDTGAAGMPPSTELLWGIGVSGQAVHYAVWNVGGTLSPGKIRRVNIGVGGILQTNTDVEILTVPASPLAPPAGWAPFVPVTDIEFSGDGLTMLLGERTMVGLTDSYNHASRVHIARWMGTNWVVQRTLETGNSWGRGEAYGGVAYGYENGAPEQIIWMTTADSATTAGPHGVQGVRPADFPPASSPTIVTNAFRVPFDPSFTATNYLTDYKGSGGDVEIMQDRPCSTVVVRRVECPEKPGDPIQVTVEVTNLSGATAMYGWWTPCPTNLLAPGSVTAQPLPASVFPLPGPLTNNGTTTLTFQLPATNSGQTVCFRLTLLDESGEVCCTEKICVDVPACDCARLLDQKISCVPRPDGTVVYTIQWTIQNLTHLSSNPFGFYHATFLPPTGFSPANVVPTPTPIPPGGTGTLTATYIGVPGRLCFHLVLHDEAIDPCCSIDVCVELPPCDPTGGHPDRCAVDEKVPCKPSATGTAIGSATVNYTVCNNSTVPRTYTWSAAGLPATPPCTKVLTAADFSPASGTIGPVAPGACVTIPITILCREFKPEDCAAFRICATSGPEAEPLCCEGIVYRPKPGEPAITVRVDPAAGLASLPVGGTATLTFEIANPGDTPLETTVVVRDEINILTFGPAGTTPRATPLFTTPVTLRPAETQALRLAVARLDQGQNAPPFAGVLAWARAGKLTPDQIVTEPPDLHTPVRLPAATTKPAERPVIQSIRLENGPPARAILSISSETGRRYRVERATSLSGPWNPAPDSDLASGPKTDGEFTGTGETVTCSVPCEPDETAVFFRVVALP